MNSGPIGQVDTLEKLGRPDLFYRRGSSDLRTYLHVNLLDGYEFPFPIDQVHTVVDAGANVGYAAVWFAQRHPGARIIAVEPDADNFSLLEQNTAAYGQITCVRAALANERGRLNLIDPGDGPWAYQTAREEGDNVIADVEAVTMPHLMELHGMPTIDVLKVDIEGGEADLFADPDEWIGAVKSIAIELHDRFRPGCSAIFERATREFLRRAQRGEDTFVAR